MKLQEIDRHFQENETKLDRYFEQEFSKTPPVFYLSTDLRHSGHKIAVVDTNLYPAGFNNLCNSFTQDAISAFKHYLEQYFPKSHKLLLFTEAHTRNKFYFENIFRLSKILESTGREVKIAALSSDFTDTPHQIVLEGKGEVNLYPLERKECQILLSGDWIPDLIISNNDFSTGIPETLLNIQQVIIPSPLLGWHQRKKSNHFKYYEQVAEEVAKITEIDPWFISCYFSEQNDVDLSKGESLGKLAKEVDHILEKIQKKYTEYKIDSTPYVFVKNDSGTYGMGMAYFTSGQEILNMNRRTRFKLLSSKGGAQAAHFIIQEGIVTADFYSGYPIEPVIYMAGAREIGGFFRINEERDEWSSLNSKGMAFSCLCLHKLDEPHERPFLNCIEKSKLIDMSFKISKIAALAAARESAHAK